MFAFVRGLFAGRKREDGHLLGKGRGRRTCYLHGAHAAVDGRAERDNRDGQDRREGRRGQRPGGRRVCHRRLEGMIQGACVGRKRHAIRLADAWSEARPSFGEPRAIARSAPEGSFTPGQCSLCENNCPLDSPGCGKGAALAQKLAQERDNGKY